MEVTKTVPPPAPCSQKEGEAFTLRQIMDERHALYAERAESQNRAVAAAMEYAKEAVAKAERAIEIRLHGMNEFREQMVEERNLYATKEALAALTDRVTRAEGTRGGSGATWRDMLAILALLLAAAAIFVTKGAP